MTQLTGQLVYIHQALAFCQQLHDELDGTLVRPTHFLCAHLNVQTLLHEWLTV